MKIRNFFNIFQILSKFFKIHHLPLPLNTKFKNPFHFCLKQSDNYKIWYKTNVFLFYYKNP